MLGVSLVDWIVILVYLFGITFIGLWAAKRVKSAASFFIGDRKFGKIAMTFFMFGSGSHSDQAVSVAAKTYTVGASGIWYQWLWLFATPFFWLIAPIFRRMRAVTTSDYFELRYGPSVSLLFAVAGIVQMMVSIGVMLKGSGAMTTAVSGGAIDPNLAIVAMTVMFVVYGMAGGMSAAIMTDVVQGMLTVVLSFLILPFALHEVGGMAGIRASISDPDMLKIVAPGEITLFFIIVVAFNALIGWVTQPHVMAVCGAGKTEMEGRVGVTLGLFCKRICTIAWMLTGLCAIVMYAHLDNPDLAYGQMAHQLLPAICPGLIGLFIASMLASVMSSCDAFMVASSGLFTQNIYRRITKNARNESHYVMVGRIVSALVVVIGIMFAFSVKSVVDGLEIFWKVAAVMGVAFWAGLFWRRATTAGAWAATLTSFIAMLFTSKINMGGFVVWDFNARLARFLPEFMLWQGNLYLPWQMIIYLGSGLLALIVVSLVTTPPDSARLDRLYACIRTPVEPNEPETSPFTLPEGVEPAPRRPLINHPDFEIPRPSMVGMLGFLASWVGVALLVGAVYWIIGA